MAITNPEVQHSLKIETRNYTIGARRAWSFICAAWQVSRDIEWNYSADDPATKARLEASVLELSDQEHNERR